MTVDVHQAQFRVIDGTWVHNACDQFCDTGKALPELLRDRCASLFNSSRGTERANMMTDNRNWDDPRFELHFEAQDDLVSVLTKRQLESGLTSQKDRKWAKIGFYAARDILAGEELVWDYAWC